MIDAAGLRVMQAIATEGSFTAAAARLGYSQPAISQMVRRLEERTGTVLVQRLGRTVRLTEAGEILARHAGPVLDSLDRAECEIKAIAGLQAGRVRLRAFPSASSTLVPAALALVKQRFPELAVSFAEAEPPEAMAALRAGECDVAITFTYSDDCLPESDDELEPFVVHTVMEDPVSLVVPRGHRLVGRDEVPMSEVAADPWIAGCPRCRGHLVALARQQGFEPEVAFETEDYVAMQGLVAAGLGVALVPDLILRTVVNEDVVTLPVRPDSRRIIHVMTTPDLQDVPAVEATIAALREVSGAVAPPHPTTVG